MRSILAALLSAPSAHRLAASARATSCAALATVLVTSAPAMAAVDTFTASVTTHFFGTAGAEHVDRNMTQNALPGQPVTFFEQSYSGGTAGDATGSGQASGRASAGHVGATVSGEVTSTKFLSQADLSTGATATVTDVLTILASSAFALGRRIHVENLLTLDGFDEHALRVNAGNTNDHFPDNVTGFVNTGVRVSGTGITTVSGSSFESFNFSQGFTSAVVNPPETINLALDFIVGVPLVTTLSIEVNGIGLTSDHDNTITHLDGFARWKADYGHTLAWGGTTIFTDALTGEVLNGVEIASASGFDYAHPLADVGGVPEPATWAMMITGFGLAGSALRRRRVQFA